MPNLHFEIMPAGVCAPFSKGEAVKLRRKALKQSAHMYAVSQTAKDQYKADLFRSLSKIFTRVGEALGAYADLLPDEMPDEIAAERLRILESMPNPVVLGWEDDGGLAA